MKQTDNRMGSLVISKCGNDKGVYYYVVSEENGFLYLADGKKKTLEAPKKKREHHVIYLGRFPEFDIFRENTMILETLARNRVLNKILKKKMKEQQTEEKKI